jgi:hypothetical protein
MDNSLCKVKNLKILYPLFANTYLLPFYAKLSEHKLFSINNVDVDDKAYDWNEDDLCIRLEESISNLENQNIDGKNDYAIVFYATEKLRTAVTNKISLDIVKIFGNNLVTANFSQYIPRFIFVPYSIGIYKLSNEIEAIFNKLEKFKNINKKIFKSEKELLKNFPKISDNIFITYIEEHYSKIHFFSDTETEAKFIFEYIFKRTSNKGNIIELDNSTKPTFNVYCYSAPYSVYFLENFPEYLPFLNDKSFLNSNKYNTELKNDFKTNNYIYCTNSCDKNNCELKNILEEFHKKYFNIALTAPYSLENVYRDYIEKDKAKTPFRILKDVNSFARCISLHHEYSSQINKSYFGNLFNLYDDEDRSDGETFDSQLNIANTNIKEAFGILVFDYLLNRDVQVNSKKVDYFNSASRDLFENTFLNGKYFFLLNNIITIYYLIFRENINQSANRIEELKEILKNENIQFEEEQVYVAYHNYFLKNLIKSITSNTTGFNIENIKEFEKIKNNLENLTNFKYNRGINNLPLKEELINSINELKRAFNKICNAIIDDKTDFFTNDEKAKEKLKSLLR